MNSSIYLGKIIGIKIRIHYTWFVVFFLIAWTLSEYYFPQQNPDWSLITNWTLGIISTLLLFICVFIHELSHSYIGKKNGVKIKSITLFIFGGIAEIEKEAKNAGIEAKMTIAGPLSSLVLVLIFFAVSKLSFLGIYITSMAIYLHWINLVLVIFNLLPAFPLDGGRLYRSLLWSKTGDIKKATLSAVNLSKFFALVLIFWGIANILIGNLIAGIWLAIIGWFIIQAAKISYRQLIIKEILSKTPVAKIMDTKIISASPAISVKKLIENFFLRYKKQSFPVLYRNNLLGIVTLKNVKKLPRKKWASTKTESIMTKIEDIPALTPKNNSFDALLKMMEFGINQLPVIKNGKFLGIISKDSISLIIAVKE